MKLSSGHIFLIHVRKMISVYRPQFYRPYEIKKRPLKKMMSYFKIVPSITYPRCCYNVSQTRFLVFVEGLSASPLSALNQADWRTFHTAAAASASRSLLKSKHHSPSQLSLFPPRPRKMKEPILLFLPLSLAPTLPVTSAFQSSPWLRPGLTDGET